MSSLFERTITRAEKLVDRALTERKIGYTVSATATANQAMALASGAAEQSRVLRAIESSGIAAYRIYKGM